MSVVQKVVPRVNVIARLGSHAFDVMSFRAHFAPFRCIRYGRGPVDSGHSTHFDLFAASMSNFACAKPATIPSTIQPNTVENMMQLFRKKMRPCNKKADATEHQGC